MPLRDVSDQFLSKFSFWLNLDRHFCLAKSKYYIKNEIIGILKVKVNAQMVKNKANTYSRDLNECLMVHKRHFLLQYMHLYFS